MGALFIMLKYVRIIARDLQMSECAVIKWSSKEMFRIHYQCMACAASVLVVLVDSHPLVLVLMMEQPPDA